ncbi:hypothetical protein SNEBB_009848 [Seison nebaliae]|nr:hypothetical protein SNEBB_009848 [Seison nebaliae]
MDNSIFLLQPKSLGTIRGNNVTFSCVIDKEKLNDQTLVTWCINGMCVYVDDFDNKRFLGNRDNGDFSITVHNVSLEDDGIYNCQIPEQNDLPFYRSTTANLSILIAPSAVNFFTDRIIGVEGTVKNITCLVKRSRPVTPVRWYLGNNLLNEKNDLIIIHSPISSIHHDVSEPVDNRIVDTTNILTIQSVSRHWDGKSLKCVADHAALTDDLFARTTIEVHHVPLLRLINDRPNRSILKEGKLTNFTCLVEANPSLITYKWFLNDFELTQFKNNFVVLNGSEALHNMVLYCEATNSIGTSRISKRLEVEYSLRYLSQSSSMLVVNEMNEEISLNCDIASYPSPTINWYYQNKIIETGTTSIIVKAIQLFNWINTPNMQSIPYPYRQNYYCIANQQGKELKKNFLIVSSTSPHIDGIEVFIRGERQKRIPVRKSSSLGFWWENNRSTPLFYDHSIFHVKEDNEIILKCITYGEPKAEKTEWKIRLEKLKEISIIESLIHSTTINNVGYRKKSKVNHKIHNYIDERGYYVSQLHIDNVQETMENYKTIIYSCRTSNKEGAMLMSIKLQLYYSTFSKRFIIGIGSLIVLFGLCSFIIILWKKKSCFPKKKKKNKQDFSSLSQMYKKRKRENHSSKFEKNILQNLCSSPKHQSSSFDGQWSVDDYQLNEEYKEKKVLYSPITTFPNRLNTVLEERPINNLSSSSSSSLSTKLKISVNANKDSTSTSSIIYSDNIPVNPTEYRMYNERRMLNECREKNMRNLLNEQSRSVDRFCCESSKNDLMNPDKSLLQLHYLHSTERMRSSGYSFREKKIQQSPNVMYLQTIDSKFPSNNVYYSSNKEGKEGRRIKFDLTNLHSKLQSSTEKEPLIQSSAISISTSDYDNNLLPQSAYVNDTISSIKWPSSDTICKRTTKGRMAIESDEEDDKGGDQGQLPGSSSMNKLVKNEEKMEGINRWKNRDGILNASFCDEYEGDLDVSQSSSITLTSSPDFSCTLLPVSVSPLPFPQHETGHYHDNMEGSNIKKRKLSGSPLQLSNENNVHENESTEDELNLSEKTLEDESEFEKSNETKIPIKPYGTMSNNLKVQFDLDHEEDMMDKHFIGGISVEDDSEKNPKRQTDKGNLKVEVKSVNPKNGPAWIFSKFYLEASAPRQFVNNLLELLRQTEEYDQTMKDADEAGDPDMNHLGIIGLVNRQIRRQERHTFRCEKTAIIDSLSDNSDDQNEELTNISHHHVNDSSNSSSVSDDGSEGFVTHTDFGTDLLKYENWTDDHIYGNQLPSQNNSRRHFGNNLSSSSDESLGDSSSNEDDNQSEIFDMERILNSLNEKPTQKEVGAKPNIEKNGNENSKSEKNENSSSTNTTNSGLNYSSSGSSTTSGLIESIKPDDDVPIKILIDSPDGRWRIEDLILSSEDEEYGDGIAYNGSGQYQIGQTHSIHQSSPLNFEERLSGFSSIGENEEIGTDEDDIGNGTLKNVQSVVEDGETLDKDDDESSEDVTIESIGHCNGRLSENSLSHSTLIQPLRKLDNEHDHLQFPTFSLVKNSDVDDFDVEDELTINQNNGNKTTPLAFTTNSEHSSEESDNERLETVKVERLIRIPPHPMVHGGKGIKYVKNESLSASESENEEESTVEIERFDKKLQMKIPKKNLKLIHPRTGKLESMRRIWLENHRRTGEESCNESETINNSGEEMEDESAMTRQFSNRELIKPNMNYEKENVEIVVRNDVASSCQLTSSQFITNENKNEIVEEREEDTETEIKSRSAEERANEQRCSETLNSTTNMSEENDGIRLHDGRRITRCGLIIEMLKLSRRKKLQLSKSGCELLHRIMCSSSDFSENLTDDDLENLYVSGILKHNSEDDCRDIILNNLKRRIRSICINGRSCSKDNIDKSNEIGERKRKLSLDLSSDDHKREKNGKDDQNSSDLQCVKERSLSLSEIDSSHHENNLSDSEDCLMNNSNGVQELSTNMEQSELSNAPNDDLDERMSPDVVVSDIEIKNNLMVSSLDLTSYNMKKNVNFQRLCLELQKKAIEQKLSELCPSSAPLTQSIDIQWKIALDKNVLIEQIRNNLFNRTKSAQQEEKSKNDGPLEDVLKLRSSDNDQIQSVPVSENHQELGNNLKNSNVGQREESEDKSEEINDEINIKSNIQLNDEWKKDIRPKKCSSNQPVSRTVPNNRQPNKKSTIPKKNINRQETIPSSNDPSILSVNDTKNSRVIKNKSKKISKTSTKKVMKKLSGTIKSQKKTAKSVVVSSGDTQRKVKVPNLESNEYLIGTNDNEILTSKEDRIFDNIVKCSRNTSCLDDNFKIPLKKKVIPEKKDDTTSKNDSKSITSGQCSSSNTYQDEKPSEPKQNKKSNQQKRRNLTNFNCNKNFQNFNPNPWYSNTANNNCRTNNNHGNTSKDDKLEQNINKKIVDKSVNNINDNRSHNNQLKRLNERNDGRATNNQREYDKRCKDTDFSKKTTENNPSHNRSTENNHISDERNHTKKSDENKSMKKSNDQDNGNRSHDKNRCNGSPENNRNKKPQNDNHSNRSDDQNSIRKLENQKSIQDSDYQKPVKESDDPKSIKKSDDQNSIRKLENQKSIKDSDYQKPVKESDDKKSLKNQDNHRSIRILDNEKSIKKSDDEKSIKKSDDQKSITKSDDQKSITKSDDQRLVKNSENPKPIKKSNDEKSIKKSNDEKSIKKSDDPKSIRKSDDQKSIKKSNDEKSIKKSNDEKSIRKSDDQKSIRKPGVLKLVKKPNDNSKRSDEIYQNNSWDERNRNKRSNERKCRRKSDEKNDRCSDRSELHTKDISYRYNSRKVNTNDRRISRIIEHKSHSNDTKNSRSLNNKKRNSFPTDDQQSTDNVRENFIENNPLERQGPNRNLNDNRDDSINKHRSRSNHVDKYHSKQNWDNRQRSKYDEKERKRTRKESKDDRPKRDSSANKNRIQSQECSSRIGVDDSNRILNNRHNVGESNRNIEDRYNRREWEWHGTNRPISEDMDSICRELRKSCEMITITLDTTMEQDKNERKSYKEDFKYMINDVKRKVVSKDDIPSHNEKKKLRLINSKMNFEENNRSSDEYFMDEESKDGIDCRNDGHSQNSNRLHLRRTNGSQENSDDFEDNDEEIEHRHPRRRDRYGKFIEAMDHGRKLRDNDRKKSKKEKRIDGNDDYQMVNLNDISINDNVRSNQLQFSNHHSDNLMDLSDSDPNRYRSIDISNRSPGVMDIRSHDSRKVNEGKKKVEEQMGINSRLDQCCTSKIDINGRNYDLGNKRRLNHLSSNEMIKQQSSDRVESRINRPSTCNYHEISDNQSNELVSVGHDKTASNGNRNHLEKDGKESCHLDGKKLSKIKNSNKHETICSELEKKKNKNNNKSIEKDRKNEDGHNRNEKKEWMNKNKNELSPTKTKRCATTKSDESSKRNDNSGDRVVPPSKMRRINSTTMKESQSSNKSNNVHEIEMNDNDNGNMPSWPSNNQTTNLFQNSQTVDDSANDYTTSNNEFIPLDYMSPIRTEERQYLFNNGLNTSPSFQPANMDNSRMSFDFFNSSPYNYNDPTFQYNMNSLNSPYNAIDYNCPYNFNDYNSHYNMNNPNSSFNMNDYNYEDNVPVETVDSIINDLSQKDNSSKEKRHPLNMTPSESPIIRLNDFMGKSRENKKTIQQKQRSEFKFKTGAYGMHLSYSPMIGQTRNESLSYSSTIMETTLISQPQQTSSPPPPPPPTTTTTTTTNNRPVQTRRLITERINMNELFPSRLINRNSRSVSCSRIDEIVSKKEKMIDMSHVTGMTNSRDMSRDGKRSLYERHSIQIPINYPIIKRKVIIPFKTRSDEHGFFADETPVKRKEIKLIKPKKPERKEVKEVDLTITTSHDPVVMRRNYIAAHQNPNLLPQNNILDLNLVTKRREFIDQKLTKEINSKRCPSNIIENVTSQRFTGSRRIIERNFQTSTSTNNRFNPSRTEKLSLEEIIRKTKKNKSNSHKNRIKSKIEEVSGSRSHSRSYTHIISGGSNHIRSKTKPIPKQTKSDETVNKRLRDKRSNKLIVLSPIREDLTYELEGLDSVRTWRQHLRPMNNDQKYYEKHFENNMRIAELRQCVARQIPLIPMESLAPNPSYHQIIRDHSAQINSHTSNDHQPNCDLNKQSKTNCDDPNEKNDVDDAM